MKTILLFIAPLLAAAQEHILPQPVGQTQAQRFGREWAVSVTMGWQFFGPARAIQHKMEQTGWTVTDEGTCFLGCTGPINYPRVRRHIPYDVEISYQKTARRGYLFGIGLPNNAYITGVRPNRNTVTLETRSWYGSFRWAWFSRNGRLVHGAGPALLVVQDFEPDHAYQKLYSDRHSQIRPGVHLSSQFRLITNESWLLALKADARWNWPVYSRTYEHVYAYTGTTYSLPSANLALPLLNVGFQIGLKIR